VGFVEVCCSVWQCVANVLPWCVATHTHLPTCRCVGVAPHHVFYHTCVYLLSHVCVRENTHTCDKIRTLRILSEYHTCDTIHMRENIREKIHTRAIEYVFYVFYQNTYCITCAIEYVLYVFYHNTTRVIEYVFYQNTYSITCVIEYVFYVFYVFYQNTTRVIEYAWEKIYERKYTHVW